MAASVLCEGADCNTDMADIQAQLQTEKAAGELVKALSVSVQSCKYACVSYQPSPQHNPPHSGYTPGFKRGDFVHIKAEYDDDWWIGRIIGQEAQVVFIPREEKLRQIFSESYKTDQLTVYQDAPVMRPIVFVGPSTKDSKLSQFLQLPLVTFMKEKFSDRLVTVVDHAPPTAYCHEMTAHSVEARVFQAGLNLNLVYLDCLANFPSDLDPASRLHPLYIGIQISRQTVLQKLVRQLTTSSGERSSMFNGADQLAEEIHHCDLLINESNLEDACQKLELFLESYWAFTRSIFLT